jgi:hypothetical protein
MSSSLTVWPLNPEIKSWLDGIGIEYPDVASRSPTGHEVKAVVDRLRLFEVEILDRGIGARWQATIGSPTSDEWVLLAIDSYSGDDREQEIYFERGWPDLMRSILVEFAKQSGPLVLVPSSGDEPIVVIAPDW